MCIDLGCDVIEVPVGENGRCPILLVHTVYLQVNSHVNEEGRTQTKL